MGHSLSVGKPRGTNAQLRLWLKDAHIQEISSLTPRNVRQRRKVSSADCAQLVTGIPNLQAYDEAEISANQV